MFQYRFIIPFSIFVKRHCAYKWALKKKIWDDWVMCPCVRWYINTYEITELSLAIYYYNNCGGINYWRKKRKGKIIFCCQIWPLHPNFSFCIPDGCVNPIIYNTEILHCKFFFERYSVDHQWRLRWSTPFFGFGQSIPSFNAAKRVWIDQNKKGYGSTTT